MTCSSKKFVEVPEVCFTGGAGVPVDVHRG